MMLSMNLLLVFIVSGLDALENPNLGFYMFNTYGGDFEDSYSPYHVTNSGSSSSSGYSGSDEKNFFLDGTIQANEGDVTEEIEDDISGSGELVQGGLFDTKSLQRIDPEQEHLKEPGYYIAPEDVKYRLTRYRRSPHPQYKSEEETDARTANGDDDDYDGYSRVYSDFVRKHFGKTGKNNNGENGSDGDASNADDDEESKNTSGSEENVEPQAGDVKNNESDEEDDENDDDDEVEKYEESDDDPDYVRVKELSQREAQKNKRLPKYCKIVIKDDQECTVCKNPKTHDTSESCSYSSAPAPKRYAFKRQKNYNSKGNRDDSANDESSAEDEPTHNQRPKQNYPKKKLHYKGYNVHENDNVDNDNSEDDEYVHERHRPMKNSKRNQKSKKPSRNQVEEKLQNYANPNYYGNYQNRHTDSPLRNQHFNDFDDDLSLRASEVQTVATPTDSAVDKVLETFKTRDWSKCKHKRENGITCYYCKENDGSTQEECMYSSDLDEDKSNRDKKDIASIFKSLDKKKTKKKSKSKTTGDVKPNVEQIIENPSLPLVSVNQRKLNRNQNYKINPMFMQTGQNSNNNLFQLQNQNTANRRMLDVATTPLEYAEPKNKRTFKRMVSYTENIGSEPTESNGNKSLFYSKIVNSIK